MLPFVRSCVIMISERHSPFFFLQISTTATTAAAATISIIQSILLLGSPVERFAAFCSGSVVAVGVTVGVAVGVCVIVGVGVAVGVAVGVGVAFSLIVKGTET